MISHPVKFLKAALTPACAVLIFASCYATHKTAKKKPQPCDPNVMCTMIFTAINLHVVSTNGEPILLDDYYTLRETTSDTIRGTPAAQIIDGNYMVLSDGYRKRLLNTEDKFRFIGIKAGRQVVNEVFIIAADCCHIHEVSGKAEVMLQ